LNHLTVPVSIYVSYLSKKLGDMPYQSNFKENAYQRYRN